MCKELLEYFDFTNMPLAVYRGDLIRTFVSKEYCLPWWMPGRIMPGTVILLMSVHILFWIDILKESLEKCRNE